MMPRDLLADEHEPIDLLADEPMMQSQPHQSFFKNAMDYEKALGLGLLQGGGDVAASIGNFPGDIYKHFAGGESPYHIPHPALQQYYPEGMAGKLGSSIGEGIGQVGIPGTGAIKAMKAVNNPLTKALAGMAAGGLGNAASNEDDRIGSGITGAALGATGSVAGSIGKGIANVPWTKGAANKSLRIAEQLVKERGIKNLPIAKDIFNESKNFLPKNLPNKKLLEAARGGDYKKLFTLQSDLGKISRELQKSSSGAERLHGMQAADLRKRMLDSMKEHLSKQGHEDIANHLTMGQQKYAKHMKYVEPAIKKAKKLGTHALGIGTGYELFKHLF